MMLLTIDNLPKKLTNKLFQKAINFFISEMIDPKVAQELQIEFKFAPYLKSSGICKYTFHERKLPREFTILINPKNSRQHILKTVAHELTHVDQYATGRLKTLKSGACKWNNKRFSVNEKVNKQYFKSPWEIEARGWEEGLYTMFTYELEKEYNDRQSKKSKKPK